MRFGFLVMGVVLVLTSGLAAQTGDEAAVNSRVDGFYAGDADARAGIWHENGVLAVGTNVFFGRANIPGPDGRLPITFTRHATTVLSPTVAVTHGSFETEYGTSGHTTITLVKEENEWFIAAFQSAPVQAAPSDEAAAQSLVGAWTLEEAEVTGGNNPGTFTGLSGLMIFTETHYSQVFVIGNERPQLGENATDAERLAAFAPFIANGGTYTLDGFTLTLQHSVAKNPNAMNVTRTNEVRFEGDDTVWFTSEPVPGIDVTQKWVRAE